jgi:acyl-CoA reductase-like NAD-dependent aldehyde dehydrogenase
MIGQDERSADQLLEVKGLFIDGSWLPADSPEIFEVVCPSTEQVVARTPWASPAGVDAAVGAARRAFDSGPWPHLAVSERAGIVERAASLLEPLAADIARVVTTEMGVPLTISEQLVERSIATMRFLADQARRTRYTEVRSSDGGSAAIVREPVGVVAAIAPWNGPFAMAVGKIVPAILAGCTVVFKPAPETPLDVAFLADALHDAGVPEGVVNVVVGGAGVGRALVASDDVDRVSFTGSTAVGRQIGALCGELLKPVGLELGGKSAAIVLEDADLEQVRAGLAIGCFFNSGQVCAALSRVLAPRSIYDEVLEMVTQAADSWVVGDPFDIATTLGPLVSSRQRDRVAGYIALGLGEGARLACGGGRPAALARGFYMEPTVFADVDNSMRIAREEIFGPVATVIPFDDTDHAVQIANDSEYGLHGAVFTKDAERARGVARRVRTGTFSINGFVYNNRMPFGGVKASGIGRDTGQEGYESFFELKTINLAPGLASRCEEE